MVNTSLARLPHGLGRDRLGDDLNNASYMVAGPPGMAQAVSAELVRAGVEPALIATDSFSGYE